MAGKKILVADDSLTIQKVIRLALSGDGYEIQTVSDGKEAIEQISLFRPDICIIDVSLPGFDAYQIREQMLQKPDLKNIPIILMSSAFEKVDETRSQKLGFAGHLVKPFDPSHLRSTLLSVSESTPANDPVVSTIGGSFGIDNFNTMELQDLPPLEQDFSVNSDDIQRLAKNTFELSGLDQHEWGMIEPGKTMDSAGSQPTQSTTSHHSGPEVSSIDLNEIPHAQGYASGLTEHQTTYTSEQVEAMVKAEVARILEDMHFQLQERIQSEVKQFTESFIPNLAEQVIKEEIHKLLSTPPV